MMNALKKARTDAGLTLRQLAERTGLAVETLSRLENNQRSPRFHTLTKIAQALDIPVSQLSDGLMDESREEVLVGYLEWEGIREGEVAHYEGERLNFRGRKIKTLGIPGDGLMLYECPNGYRVYVAQDPVPSLHPNRKNPETGETEYLTYPTAEDVVTEFPEFRGVLELHPVRYLD